MKKYLIIASAALVALAACNKEVEFQEPANNTDEVVLTFTSERPQFEAGTKTAWDATNSCIVWESTDKIRVGYTLNGNWMGQEEAGTAKFYASKEVTIDDTDSSVGTFQVPITGSGVTAFTDPETNGTYKFYSIYPYTILSSTTVNDPTSQSITLATTQTPGANTFDHSTDIMVGVTDNMSITGLPTDPIELNWKRVVAHAALSFTNMGFVGTEIPNKITLTFNEAAKVAGSFSVNITDGTIGAGSANEIILEGSGLTVNSTSINAWATVLPVSFSSLNVEIKTDKATYARSITGLDKTFKGNARNTLTINMATASRTASAQYEWVKTALSAITASDVFVIVGNNGATYAMSNDKGTGSAPAAVAVTVANDKLMAAPADMIQWTLTKDGSNYTFYPNGTTTTWLYCINSNNGLKVGDTADNNAFIIKDNYLYNNGQSRYIGIYNSQDWRSYTSINNNIKDQTFVFYVRTATGPAVTWNLESISISNPPTKTTYTAGQSFDPTGMVVTGHFVDADDATNTKDEAVTGYTITPDGALTVSDTQVTITYQGMTATQNITVNAAPAGNDGSLEHPFTVSEVRAYMDASESNRGPVYITGIVSSVYAVFDQSHGTGIFYISDDGETTSDQFEAYSVKFLGNNAWVNGNTQIAVGNTVIVYGGELTIYNNSVYETKSGSGSYLYSLNGVTSETVPTITVSEITGVAAAGVSGATTSVTLANNDGWSASVAGDGAIVTSASISGSTITYSVAANSGDARTGSITVTLTKSGRTDAIATINVSQLAGNGDTSATVSFTGSSSGGMTTTAGEQTGTKSGVTVQITNGVVSGDQIRIYKNANITITAPSGKNITKVVFTTTTSSGNYSAVGFPNGNGYTGSGNTGTWTGSSQSVTLTASAYQVRATEIKVTYE